MNESKTELVQITVELLEAAEKRQKLRIPENVSLLEVLQEGANLLDVDLLPNGDDPLDVLRNFNKRKELGDPLDLSFALEDVLAEGGTSRHFAIDLVLAIRVNARWAVAPESQMTPRRIAELFDLDFTQYTLYRPDSDEPLPLDESICLTRGMAFEAQRDGKYGARSR